MVAEQYRVAATRLADLGSESDSMIVLVTSAMKGDGKTSTVANLGYTLACDLDEPTLMIDCDFKRPSLHKVMGLPCEPGLAECFYEEESVDSCLTRVEGVPLWLLPAGNIEENPVQLFKMPKVASLIHAMKSRFRFILIDGPPVLPLADINVLSGLASVLLFVVRSGITPKDVIYKSMEMMKPTAQARIVLTDAWSQGVPYYVKQGYDIPYVIGEKG